MYSKLSGSQACNIDAGLPASKLFQAGVCYDKSDLTLHDNITVFVADWQAGWHDVTPTTLRWAAPAGLPLGGPQ